MTFKFRPEVPGSHTSALGRGIMMLKRQKATVIALRRAAQNAHPDLPRDEKALWTYLMHMSHRINHMARLGH